MALPNTRDFTEETSSKIPLPIYMIGLAVLWSFIVGVSLFLSVTGTHKYSEDYALIQARTAFERDVLYRHWNDEVGGFFVIASEAVPPNSDLIDSMRVVETTEGLRLAKVNADYMTRLVHEMDAMKDGVKMHLTSSYPIRKESEADDWEAEALERLEKEDQPTEISEPVEIGGQKYMRFMRPLIAETSCLSCHFYRALKPGEVLGGISVTLPMAPILNSASRSLAKSIFSHLLFWILGLLGIFFGGQRLGARIAERDMAERQLRELASELEMRVEQRTADLACRQQELQAFMDNTEAGVYLKNSRQQYILVNRRFSTLGGLEPEAFIGRTDNEILPSEFTNRLAQRELEVMLSGIGAELEAPFGEGEDRRIHECFIFPLFNAQNKIDGVGGIVVDISARKRLEADLIAAKNAAESANKAKSEFLANISHEIRTPLNGVLGMADLLFRTKLSADQASMVATIKAGGDSLLAVLNDILDFSKIEAGKMLLDPRPFHLRDIIFNTVKSLTPIAYKKKLEVIVYISPKVPECLVGDYARLRQVILNLVSNAIKFTAKGEVTIIVRLVAQNDKLAQIRFTVSDTGIGIPLDKQAQIFDAFEQADASTTRQYGGTGLGLAISNRLVGLMGGHLSLKSQPGQGSSFAFNLIMPYLPDSEAKKPMLSTEDLNGLKALVVDDNATNRKIFVSFLAGWNMEADEAAGTDEGLASLRQAARTDRPYDLVLTDLQMPGQDGLDLLRQMRSDPALKHLPVIILSSGNLPENAVGENALYQAHLTKPVRPEELLRAVAASLNVWETLDRDQLQAQAEEEAHMISSVALKILLAEDMEMNQLVASRMLTELGHQVVIADDGRKALEAIRREYFDLILMDIQMPVMDGLQATSYVRKTEANHPGVRHIPIVAMTAHALKGDQNKYLSLGMDGYISKPITMNELAGVLEEMAVRFNLGGYLESIQAQAEAALAAKDALGPEGAVKISASEEPALSPSNEEDEIPAWEEEAGGAPDSQGGPGPEDEAVESPPEAGEAGGVGQAVAGGAPDSQGGPGPEDEVVESPPEAGEAGGVGQAVAGGAPDSQGGPGPEDEVVESPPEAGGAGGAGQEPVEPPAPRTDDLASDKACLGESSEFAPLAIPEEELLTEIEEVEAAPLESKRPEIPLIPNSHLLPGKILDLKVVRQFLGDELILIKKSMEIYLRDAPVLAAQIQAALAADDRKTLGEKSHALKGISAYFTKGELYRSALALEHFGRGLEDENSISPQKELARIIKSTNRLYSDIKSYLAEHG